MLGGGIFQHLCVPFAWKPAHTRGVIAEGRGQDFRLRQSRSDCHYPVCQKPESKEHGKIYFHDIGDYLTQQQKLDIIRGFKSVSGIAEQNFWQEIVPDDHNDWINQRDDSFDLFIVTGNKGKSNEKAIFENYSLGLMTTRDAWCFNYSAQELTRNIIKMVSFYNTELDRYIANPHRNTANISDFVSSDGAKIKWSNNLKGDLEKIESWSLTQIILELACIDLSQNSGFTLIDR